MIEEISGKRKVTFISHASEDKRFVKNLTDTLIRFSVEAWYDEYEIQVGDSIRTKLNEGLRNSEYGVVVLSPDFFRKDWPPRELAALGNLLGDGHILPVLYNLTPEELKTHDPLLSDVKGIVVHPDRDVRDVAAPIAAKILGTAERDENGRAVYRSRTVKIADLPLSADQCLEDMTFEDCVVQGIAVLTPRDGEVVEFIDITWETPHTFIPVADNQILVGTYGLRRVTFRGCRFKDVGITADKAMLEMFMASPERPEGWVYPDHLL